MGVRVRVACELGLIGFGEDLNKGVFMLGHIGVYDGYREDFNQRVFLLGCIGVYDNKGLLLQNPKK